MVLTEAALRRAGLQVVMVAELTGSVDDEAFEHDEGSLLGVEKVIFSDYAQTGLHGGMAQAADLKVGAFFAAFPADAFCRQPVGKSVFLAEALLIEGDLRGEKEGPGVFPFKGLGQAVPAEPPGADDDRFGPGKALFRFHAGRDAFIKRAARRFLFQSLLEAFQVFIHLVDGDDAAVVVAGKQGLLIDFFSKQRRGGSHSRFLSDKKNKPLGLFIDRLVYFVNTCIAFPLYFLYSSKGGTRYDER